MQLRSLQELDRVLLLLRTPEGGAPGTAHEGRRESRELNEDYKSGSVYLINVWFVELMKQMNLIKL